MDSMKEWFDSTFYRDLAQALAARVAGFDSEAFQREAGAGLAALELKARLWRTVELCRKYLPADYRQAVEILREVAPRYDGEFKGMFCPEFVGCYGLKDYDYSMEALKYFTPFSTSESAVRPFLRQDLQRGLAYMQRWSMDADEHVRRLASEGCRPRLPWSFQLTELMADPRPVLPILQNLRADGSLYVRKSVANHLNDISKDHAEWMLDQVATWDLGHVHTAWIVKRAARTLIKAGHPRSFVLLGFEREPRVAVGDLTLSATQIKLGEQLHFSFELRAEKETKQRLVVDYAVHFMKKSGRSTAKVFKLKEIELHPGQEVALVKVHKFQDYSTRKHYGGEHGVEIFINGHSVAQASFTLVC